MEKGKIIVIEGACDGIGKTSQYHLLCKHMQEEGIKVVYHHFPSYGTYPAFGVEKYLQGAYGSPETLSPYFIHNLYAYDRAITWHTNLNLYYQQGYTILLDRYTTSSLIYQSANFEKEEEKKQFLHYAMDFEYNKMGLKEPDSIIFLQAPFDLVAQLRKNRKTNEGIQNDIHEKDLIFMKKVYENSMWVADCLSWTKIQCNKGNQMRDMQDIHKEIYSLVTHL